MGLMMTGKVQAFRQTKMSTGFVAVYLNQIPTNASLDRRNPKPFLLVT